MGGLPTNRGPSLVASWKTAIVVNPKAHEKSTLFSGPSIPAKLAAFSGRVQAFRARQIF